MMVRFLPSRVQAQASWPHHTPKPLCWDVASRSRLGKAELDSSKGNE